MMMVAAAVPLLLLVQKKTNANANGNEKFPLNNGKCASNPTETYKFRITVAIFKYNKIYAFIEIILFLFPIMLCFHFVAAVVAVYRSPWKMLCAHKFYWISLLLSKMMVSSVWKAIKQFSLKWPPPPANPFQMMMIIINSLKCIQKLLSYN